MLAYVVGGGVMTLFGSNIRNKIVTNTINLVYNGVSFVFNGSDSCNRMKDIHMKIKSLDIDLKIDMVNVICGKIKHDDISRICEINTEELVRRIVYLRDLINKELEECTQKWFYSYRTINLDIEIKELSSLVFMLDGRISMLMSLLK